ncbi:MAG: hypothetical protein K8T89_05435 [Planctomycetes bacterium]|nr:hypothetical protein [Planctomycetota bacterium]
MPTEIPLLRFMVLSALIGFVVFCASYSILVWKKRRQPSPVPVTTRSRLRRWSVTAIVLGCLGILTTFVVRETVRAEGMLGGDGLFAVRSAPEMRIVHLAEEGPIKEGEVLARFSSPEALGDIQQAELLRDQLKNDKEILKTMPLSLPADLVRDHDTSKTDLRQYRVNLINLQLNRDSTVREWARNIGTERNNWAKFENDLRLAQGEYRTAVAKREKAIEQLAAERKLAQTQNFNTLDLKDREKEVAALAAEITKHENHVASIEKQITLSKELIAKFEKQLLEPPSELVEKEADTKKEIAAATTRCEEFEKLRIVALEKAQEHRQSDLAGLDNKIQQAVVALQAKQNKIEIKAPYDGQVVYRHSSPGLNHGPVLVLSRQDSMRFRFRLPEEQVAALRDAGNVTIELEETANTVEQRFPGKFLQATSLTREPGMALVDLEVQAPPETVGSLAEGKPIKARFSWRPPMFNLWPFPVSVALIAVGIFGLIVVNLSGWRPTWTPTKVKGPNHDDEDVAISFARVPAPKEGDTVDAIAETIPVRPPMPNVPRERPVQPWEHPVGIRLREAIIREEVSQELLNAVEMAIEHQQDAVIVPMREALRRAPTVPEHARAILDKLNNSETKDELKMIEQRCLAQRLTFLLYTLGMEIPSHANRISKGPGVHVAGN